MADDAFAGPVDYLVFAFPAGAPVGAGLADVLRRVEEGTIEVLDLEIIRRDAAGEPVAGALDPVEDASADGAFAGAYSGILDAEDVQRVAEALEPGGFALALVYEDRSLAPAAEAWLAAGGTELFAGGVDIIDLAETVETGAREGVTGEVKETTE
ncbi:hypothetical protein [Leifsonia shinshuensis]